MKKLFFLLLLLPFIGLAQQKHTVAPKETLFSIGRLYNVHPRELAEYNNISYGTGLTIGQVLNIPAKKTMQPLPPVSDNQTPVAETKPAVKPAEKKIVPVTSKAKKDTGGFVSMTKVVGIPIYHKVQKKETLYQISRLYNKVPIDDLKKWNKLSSDALSEGTNLIVGYSASGNAAVKTIKEEPQVKIEKTVPPVVEKKPEVIIEKTVPVQTETVKVPVMNNADIDFKGGVFKNLFNSQTKDGEIAQEEGSAGVFKSTSGWNDGKYYCLHNTAAPGTIIKVTNKSTGKSIYAKVLDIIPDLKQNLGLMIRISNAASAELGAGENNFECTLSYSK